MDLGETPLNSEGLGVPTGRSIGGDESIGEVLALAPVDESTLQDADRWQRAASPEVGVSQKQGQVDTLVDQQVAQVLHEIGAGGMAIGGDVLDCLEVRQEYALAGFEDLRESTDLIVR